MDDNKLVKLKHKVIQAERIQERIAKIQAITEMLKESSIERIQIFNDKNCVGLQREWIAYYSLGFESQAEMDSWFRDLILDRINRLHITVKEEFKNFEIE